MNNISDPPGGVVPPSLQELPRIEDRQTFLYLEKCKISVQDSALKGEDKEGWIFIPTHAFLVIILGPGTSITHRAIELLSNSGTAIIWTGESGLKYYGYGKPLSKSATLLIKQAKIVSTPKLHMEAAKKLYKMRFSDEDTDFQTLFQLRGKEGNRMRKEYSRWAEKWNVPWNGRHYDHNDFSKADPVNRALSIANTCLYGLVFSVISGLGLSPGLGIIHIGLEASFVYDIADLYKTEITIPLCFELAAKCPNRIEHEIRRELRKRIYESSLVPRMVNDILYVLDIKEKELEIETLMLWDSYRGNIQAGVQYRERGY